MTRIAPSVNRSVTWLFPRQSQGGTTTMTIRSFVIASSLDDFDDKASLSERTRWWERRMGRQVESLWASPEVAISGKELAFKIVSACASLPDKIFLGVQDEILQVQYVRLREALHHEATQGGDPPDFLYRPNATADRADIRYKKSERRREQPVKRFTHQLVDSQLKNILKCQRFKSMDDLEYVLKQKEDDWNGESHNASSTKTLDSRADKPQSGATKNHESPKTQEAVEPREVSVENQAPSMSIIELT
ncbi:hypothetical protein PHMEG_0005400 [Phytophthora megakarya]|uniref:Uncharacterized protein n=1 Tax=Phytophthora megakarya TaxID=4795 RepID=A0A225WRH7_9STRA|nr:hypothetical protein PHMEG_0005393 [Phytophthora megakarya]OWZ20225.1 hypothetical protein PHMEG_0005400 [Phytophthora megakarya]